MVTLTGADQSLNHLASKKWFDKLIRSASYTARADNLMAIGNLCNIGMGVAVLPTYFEKYFPGLRNVHVPHEFIGSDLWLLTHKDLKNLSRIKVTMDFFHEKILENLGIYL